MNRLEYIIMNIVRDTVIKFCNKQVTMKINSVH